MSDLVERPARNDDYEALYRLHVASMRDYVAATYGWNDQVQESMFRDHWARDRPGLRVLLDGDEIVAAYRVDRRAHEIYLGSIEVAPPRQDRGIGTHVIRALLAEARAEHKKLALHVMKVNPRAMALYRRLGFAIVDESTTHYRMVSGPPGSETG
jgi:ribosomal protein S18 acetylase RimI-like enzyme